MVDVVVCACYVVGWSLCWSFVLGLVLMLAQGARSRCCGAWLLVVGVCVRVVGRQCCMLQFVISCSDEGSLE